MLVYKAHYQNYHQFYYIGDIANSLQHGFVAHDPEWRFKVHEIVQTPSHPSGAPQDTQIRFRDHVYYSSSGFCLTRAVMA